MLWNLKGACAHNHFTSYVVVLCQKYSGSGSSSGLLSKKYFRNFDHWNFEHPKHLFVWKQKNTISTEPPQHYIEPGQLWKNRTRTCSAHHHYVTARARAPSIDIYLKSESRDGSHPPYIEVHYGELHISRPKPFLGSTKTQTWGISNQNNNKHQENNQIKFLKLFKLFYNP